MIKIKPNFHETRQVMERLKEWIKISVICILLFVFVVWCLSKADCFVESDEPQPTKNWKRVEPDPINDF